MTLVQALIIFGLVISLIGFYGLGMFLNKRTPIPEGCELPSLSCDSCPSEGCGYSKSNRGIDLKAEIKKELLLSKSEEGESK
jgi:hypothetical protein